MKAMQSPYCKCLRDHKENAAFGWLVFFSIVSWLFLAFWIVSSQGSALLVIGVLILVKWFSDLFTLAYFKMNAIEVTGNQFPEIYKIAKGFSDRLGEKTPTVYVLQDGIWNSFAARIAGKRQVVLLSGAIDSILLKGNMNQLAWLVGHELGHHFAGHLDFSRRITARLGSWFVWAWLWYQRRCELTCDRYGLVCANSLEDSLRSLCSAAAGAQLAPFVNVDEAITQAGRHSSELFVRYCTLYSTHPHLLCRMEKLKAASRELGGF